MEMLSFLLIKKKNALREIREGSVRRGEWKKRFKKKKKKILPKSKGCQACSDS